MAPRDASAGRGPRQVHLTAARLAAGRVGIGWGEAALAPRYASFGLYVAPGKECRHMYIEAVQYVE